MEELAFLEARIAELQEVMEAATRSLQAFLQRKTLIQARQRRAERVAAVMAEPVDAEGIEHLRPGTSLARVEEAE